MTRYRFTLMTCLLLTLWFHPLHADVTLKFGVYTSDKPSTMVKKFRPALTVLESKLTAQLGEPVRISMQVAKTYEQGIADLVQGRVDFSRFGPASYVEARHRNPDISILAVESHKGEKVFYGIICVAEDSPIDSIEDLRGTRFAFGSDRSTIGRYLSQNYLLEHGLRASDLRTYDYLGRHDKVGAAVALGTFDAGALKEGTFKKLVEKGEPLRAIAKFPNVTKPWLARADMPDRVRRALRAALLDFDDQASLKRLKKDGFLQGEDSDYRTIRLAMEVNGSFFE